MQFEALFRAPEPDVPSVTAASAIAAPTMARIKAYSAAEAPDWSFSMLMNVFISVSFHLSTRAPRVHKLRLRVGSEEMETKPSPVTARWNRVNGRVAGAPERSAA